MSRLHIAVEELFLQVATPASMALGPPISCVLVCMNTNREPIYKRLFAFTAGSARAAKPQPTWHRLLQAADLAPRGSRCRRRSGRTRSTGRSEIEGPARRRGRRDGGEWGSRASARGGESGNTRSRTVSSPGGHTRRRLSDGPRGCGRTERRARAYRLAEDRSRPG